MILYTNECGKIYGYNDSLTVEDEELELKKENAFRYEKEFSWGMGDNRDGYKKEFYLEENGTIRIEYVEIFTYAALTPAEQQEARETYIMAML